MDPFAVSFRVFLIEHPPEVAAAIHAIFSETKGCTLYEGLSLPDLLKDLPGAPDLVLFTHQPARQENDRILREILKKYPHTYVIVSLQGGDGDAVVRYMQAGASGFAILGNDYLSSLTDAIKKGLERVVERKASLLDSFSGMKLFQPEADQAHQKDIETLHPGQTILHYRIIGAIGEGGMGVIYRAEDLKLGRNVAIKILPNSITKNPMAKKRLIHEAQAASALNHPNIVTIHAIEEADEMSFIVMEYVEGESLKKVLDRGPLEFSLALDLGNQIAQALESAHKIGLIHRDIKPANIMIAAGSTVKLLDFGLAKWLTSHQEDTRLTASGQTVGTVMYMSPEQAKGEVIDSRTDLFSFGSVLYEMATDHPAFDGETPALIFDAILNRDPVSPLEHNPKLPAEFEHIIFKALEKDPDLRYQSVSELRADLRRLRRDSSTGVYPVAGARSGFHRKKTSRKVPITVTSAILAVALVAVFLWLRLEPESVSTPAEISFKQLTDFTGLEIQAAISPDGNQFAYSKVVSGNADIFLQRVGGSNPMNLTASSPDNDTSPAFSPDGQAIVFRSEREGGGIFVMGATGESVRRLADFGYSPAWSPDGKQIVVSTEFSNNPNARGANGALYTIHIENGEKRLISKEDAVQPAWSPHGYRIAYWGLVDLSIRNIWTVPANGGEPVPVTDDIAMDWSPRWAPDGKHLYFASDRGGTMNLWRVAIDEKTGKVLGQPEPLTTPSRFVGQLSLSANGDRMVFAAFDRKANIARMSFNPQTEELDGRVEYITTGTTIYRQPSPSPDGKLLVYRSEAMEDLFVSEINGANIRRLTNDPFKDRAPVWSPDSKRILFYSDRNGTYHAWTIRPDGSQLALLIDEYIWFPHWSPDGKQIAVSNIYESMLFDLGPSPAQNRKTVLPRLNQKGDIFMITSWSPDGQWLAGGVFGADQKAKPGVYIYSIRTKEYVKLSETGDQVVDEIRWWCGPQWLSDSRRLIFPTHDGLWLANRETGKTKEILKFPAGASYLDVKVLPDNTSIFFTDASVESDIWLAEFKIQGQPSAANR